MNTKKLTLGITVSLRVACTPTKNTSHQESLHFRNYSLAICLGSVFESEETKSDFNKAANGYMERGNMSIEGNEEARLLVYTWLKRGGQIHSAKCFDLYHSSELSELFERFDPCQSKDGWINEDDYYESCDVNGDTH